MFQTELNAGKILRHPKLEQNFRVYNKRNAASTRKTTKRSTKGTWWYAIFEERAKSAEQKTEKKTENRILTNP